MSNLIEIRWHGRGGQGAKTASLLLADAAFNTGKYIQGFPEYGPERMGAPITAYNRISDEPITVHSNIYYHNSFPHSLATNPLNILMLDILLNILIVLVSRYIILPLLRFLALDLLCLMYVTNIYL